MDLKSKQELIRKLAPIYQKASKKIRGKILDNLVLATGYHRLARFPGAASPASQSKKKTETERSKQIWTGHLSSR